MGTVKIMDMSWVENRGCDVCKKGIRHEVVSAADDQVRVYTCTICGKQTKQDQ